MSREKIQIQMYVDGRAVWRVERDIKRQYCRRMTPAELETIGKETVETIQSVASKTPREVELTDLTIERVPDVKPQQDKPRKK